MIPIDTELSGRFAAARQALVATAGSLSQFTGRSVILALAPVQFPQAELTQWREHLLQIHSLLMRLAAKKMPDIERALLAAGLNPFLLELLREDDFSTSIHFFRPDCVITRDGLKVLEFNIDYGAMGINAGSSLVRVYQSQLPADQQRVGELFPAARTLAQYFAARACGRAISLWDIDGRGADILSENRQLCAALKSYGTRAHWIAGKEITTALQDGEYVFRVFAHINLVVNPALAEYFRGLPERSFSENDLGLRSLVMDSKCLMAAAWDDADCADFSPEETALLRRYIPVTYILNAQSAILALAERDKWVLKPEFGFHGRAVLVGRDTSQAEWQRALSTAAAGSRFVVQQAQQATEISAWVAYDHRAEQRQFSHIINFYFMNGGCAGTSLRLSQTAGKIGAINQDSVLGCLIEEI